MPEVERERIEMYWFSMSNVQEGVSMQTTDVKPCNHISIISDSFAHRGNTNIIIVDSCEKCGKILKLYVNRKEWVEREQVMKTMEKVIHEQVDALIKLTKR